MALRWCSSSPVVARQLADGRTEAHHANFHRGFCLSSVEKSVRLDGERRGPAAPQDSAEAPETH